VSFRADGQTALDWAASYLEGVRERPVLSGVRPGDIRALLPGSPPEQAEPFAAVLRDLDELLLPGVTHWNHPRFFAYFATTGSEPGILAELLTAALNVNAMVWSTSPAATELEQVVVDWLAQLLGLPRDWHGHIEDTASTSTIAALAAARTLRPGGAVYASEHANFSVEKAARLFETWVASDPNWELAAPRPFSTVCFRHRSADNEELVRRANATGELFVATTKLRDEPVIRLAIGNAQTTEDDVRRAWEVLRESAG